MVGLGFGLMFGFELEDFFGVWRWEMWFGGLVHGVRTEAGIKFINFRQSYL